MLIKTKCQSSQCQGRTVCAKAKDAGKRMRCPKCGNVVSIPMPSPNTKETIMPKPSRKGLTTPSTGRPDWLWVVVASAVAVAMCAIGFTWLKMSELNKLHQQVTLAQDEKQQAMNQAKIAVTEKEVLQQSYQQLQLQLNQVKQLSEKTVDSLGLELKRLQKEVSDTHTKLVTSNGVIESLQIKLKESESKPMPKREAMVVDAIRLAGINDYRNRRIVIPAITIVSGGAEGKYIGFAEGSPVMNMDTKQIYGSLESKRGLVQLSPRSVEHKVNGKTIVQSTGMIDGVVGNDGKKYTLYVTRSHVVAIKCEGQLLYVTGSPW